MAKHAPVESKPAYVGVAAVRTREQVESLSRLVHLLPSEQILACGFQVSDKTLRGELNNYPAIYPLVDELDSLVGSEVFTGMEFHLHFSPEGNEGLLNKLQQLSEMVGPKIQGLQINQSFPNVEAVQWWRNAHPHQRVILPITERTLQPDIYNAHDLYLALRDYDGLVTDLLFDMSGGRGELLDSTEAWSYLWDMRKFWPELRFGVAGGLGPLNMSPLTDLVGSIWPLSWDAQSNLCFKGGGLDMTKVDIFVQVSAKLRSWAK